MNPILSLHQRLVGLLVPALLALTLLPAAPAASAASVQGSGRVVSETRSLPPFEAVRSQGSIDIVVSQGATQQVTVQADDNLLPLLETVVEDGPQGATLRVGLKRGTSVWGRSELRVTLVMPRLSSVATAGSGDVRVSRMDTPSLRVAVAGSGAVRLEQLSTQALNVSLSGSGDVSGSGTADKLSLSLAGSGDLRLAEMKAQEVTLSIAGSGDAAVHADRTLEVSIAGSGDVTYSGNAALKSRVAGSGSISKR